MFFKKAETLSAGAAVKLDDDLALKEMNTKHLNYINGLKVYEMAGDKIKTLVTSDINGVINLWEVGSF